LAPIDRQHCPKCGHTLALDAFSPSQRGRSGAYCRGCKTALAKAIRAEVNQWLETINAARRQ